MQWLKHYENAHTNRLIQALLLEKNGHELYAMYWLLLELLCKEFKKDTTKFTVSIDQINNALHVKYSRKSERFLKVLVEFAERFDRDLIKLEQISEKFYKIETPIILELMGKDFKRTRHRRCTGAAKNKNKNKNKNIILHVDSGIDRSSKIAELWNAMAKEYSLPKVKLPISNDRKKLVSIALKEFPDFEDWVKIIDEIPNDNFRRGVNDRAWKANFDWLFHKTKYNYRKLWEAANAKNNNCENI